MDDDEITPHNSNLKGQIIIIHKITAKGVNLSIRTRDRNFDRKLWTIYYIKYIICLVYPMFTPVILHTVGFRARQNSITNKDTLIDNHITDLASQTVIEKPSAKDLSAKWLFHQRPNSCIHSIDPMVSRACSYEPITSSLGLKVTVITRFVCVDYLARAFETGQEIEGNYRLPLRHHICWSFMSVLLWLSRSPQCL